MRDPLGGIRVNRFLALAAAACLLCLSLPVAAGDSHVALVKSVSGKVVIARGDSLDVEAAGGSRLRVTDRVITQPGATAAIVFKDGTMLSLGGGADVRLRDFAFEPREGRYAFSLYLEKGSAIYESGRIGQLAPEEVEVETPRATVGVRGTRFLIEVAG